jgi:hypothetical protein
MFLEPVKIMSPYSGHACLPQITTFTQGGKIYENVAYTDPVTGGLVKRGTVSIKDAKTGAVIQDWKNSQINSLNNKSYRS